MLLGLAEGIIDDTFLLINNYCFFSLQVNGFPTLNLYKNGEIVEEFSGKRELEDLEAFVNKHLKGDDKKEDTEEEKKEKKDEL